MAKLKSSWKCNTPGLLKEILANPGTGTLRIPIQLFADMLAEVAARASQINDAQLNGLMAKLALYEITDPYSKEYDAKKSRQLLKNKIGGDAAAALEAMNKIKARIAEIEKDYDHVLTGSVATVVINAPRALEQVAAEAKLQTLHWVLGTTYKSKLKGYDK